MTPPDFEGWHLLGAFPDQAPDDVGSWLLVNNGEAMLVEVPPGLTAKNVKASLRSLNAKLLYITASHSHEDHLDADVWNVLARVFPEASPIAPSSVRGDMCLFIGGEPVWLVKAPKHSVDDIVVVFRGVAMTGDIELGTLSSVNDEVPLATKRRSMKRLKEFCSRTDYRVHSTVSAHLNDFRTSVDWESLFTV